MDLQNPSEQIQKIRKIENRKRKITNFIAWTLAAAITFCGGFVGGVIFNRTQNPVPKTDSENKTVKNDSTKNQKPAGVVAEEKDMKALSQRLAAIIKDKYPEVELSFAIKNLDNDAYMEYNEKQMNSASLIKLFVMEFVLDKKEGSTIKFEEDKLDIMMTRSDNEAANHFINFYGIPDEATKKISPDHPINRNIQNRGYKNTSLNRLMYGNDVPYEVSIANLQNYTSPGDVCKMLEGIYKGTHFNRPDTNKKAMDLLANQVHRTELPSLITEKYPDIKISNKTGELATVENDAAIIESDKFNLVFVVMTDNIPEGTDKAGFRQLIAEMGLELTEHYMSKNQE